MERFQVSVLISNSNGTEKSFEESHEGSLKSIMIALKNIKDKTNKYLTGIVDEEKKLIELYKKTISGNKSQEPEYVEKGNTEESDVEIEDDYIDSKIKSELLSEQSSSNKSDKRTKSHKRGRKRGRY